MITTSRGDSLSVFACFEPGRPEYVVFEKPMSLKYSSGF